jgi:hypothetical protein
MKTETKNKLPLFYQLFAVNKSAGQLRFTLFLTIFFIYWSLIAQSGIQSASSFISIQNLNSNPSNFTSGIIQNLFQMYFSPTVLILTYMPVFIFINSRKLFIYFLASLHPSSRKKMISKFLNNCAFSFHQGYFNFEFDEKPRAQNKSALLNLIGGPSKVSFPPNSIVIVSNLQDHTYYAIRSNQPNSAFDHSFSFGEKLLAIFTPTNYKISFDRKAFFLFSRREINLKHANVAIDLDKANLHSGPVSRTKISATEALCLANLCKNNKDILIAFIKDEINYFLDNESSQSNYFSQYSSTIKQDHHDVINQVNKATHSNHKNIIGKKKFAVNKIARKHKHTIYKYINKSSISNANNLDIQDELINLELKMNKYLNKQIQEFFNVSQIINFYLSIK